MTPHERTQFIGRVWTGLLVVSENVDLHRYIPLVGRNDDTNKHPLSVKSAVRKFPSGPFFPHVARDRGNPRWTSTFSVR